MKNLIILSLSFFLTFYKANAYTNKELEMECIYIERFFRSMERCENSEVICYVYSNHNKEGLSCKFK